MEDYKTEYYVTIKSQLQNLLSPFYMGDSLKNPCEAFTRLSLHLPENDVILLEIIRRIDDHFFGIGSGDKKANLSAIGRAKTPFFQWVDDIPHDGKLTCGDVKAMILVIVFLLSEHVAILGSCVDVSHDDHKHHWQTLACRLNEKGYQLNGLDEDKMNMLLRFFYVMSAFFSMPRAVTERNQTALIASTSFLVGCDGCTRGTKLGGIREFFEPIYELCSDLEIEESILDYLRNLDKPVEEEQVRLVVKRKISRSRKS